MSLTFHSSLINNFRDIIGGINGTPANVTWKSTLRGLKPAFEGFGSKVDYGNSGTFGITGTNISICSWVFSTVGGSDIIGKYAGGTPGQRSYALSITSSGKIVFNLSNDGEASGLVGVTGNTDVNGHWCHIIATYDGVDMRIYVNGVLDCTPAAQTGDVFLSTANLIIHGGQVYGSNRLLVDDSRMYDNTLSAAESLALYNSTSAQTGVKLSEFSYSHDPAAVIPVIADTVLQIGGKLAGDAVDTISDRSGKGNHAEIHGAMPAGGFLAGGRRYDGADDYLDCGNDISLNPGADDFVYRMIFKQNTLGSNIGLFNKTYGTNVLITMNSQELWVFCASGAPNVKATIITLNTYVCVSIVLTGGDTISIYNDGVLVGSDTYSGALSSSSPMLIGSYANNIDGAIVYASMSRTTSTLENEQQLFNALAVLPFWSINYRDYPDNVTTYSDRFPHSSTIIASGAFKVDDDKIQCTAVGTLTYSASNEFDGQEYVSVTIAGTKYSGTGTITQGNTTVSVAQGSNKITVVMGTGDTIDKIRIQFRATV